MSIVLELSTATWPEVRDAIQKGMDTAILAIGSMEQHGPHMPFATDTLIGDALCKRVAARLGGALITPSLSLGCSEAHMDFPGTLTADSKVLAALVNSYSTSLKRHGFKRVILLPSHGGNFDWIRHSASALATELEDVHFEAFTDWMLLKDAFEQVMSKDGLTFDGPGLHAGEIETSIMLHLHPDLVHMDRAECGCMSVGEKQPFSGSIKQVSPIGVLGDPRLAESRRGAEYLEAWTSLIVKQVGR